MNQVAQVEQAGQAILRLSGLRRDEFPRVALVLGSGLGDLAGRIEQPITIAYQDISGFPVSTMKSHAGQLVVGRLAGCPVACMSGRFHLYEGYSADEVCLGVRSLAVLGARTLIISNAAGSLNPYWEAGELMLIADHINFTGHNPLTGPNHQPWGPRYPDMSQAYCPKLRQMALNAALKLGLRLNTGVYVALAGPNLETPAETRALRFMGADAVGMSTVLEVIAARHMDMRVLGLSCLTNKNLPDCMDRVTEQDILEVANRSGAALTSLVKAVLAELATC